ncbi:hypothetical protein BGP_0989 [Beggiatoa sp. PS]|nr:hypothetical protein BGP_0989 [Beggiatoa sp. PS]
MTCGIFLNPEKGQKIERGAPAPPSKHSKGQSIKFSLIKLSISVATNTRLQNRA